MPSNLPLVMYPQFGPLTYLETFTAATLDGDLGKVHETVNESAKDLICTPKTSFPLQGDGFETRKGKFLNTMQTFFNGAGAVGSVLGTGVMLPVDFTVGRGSEGGGMFMDEGVLGAGAVIAGTVASTAAEYVGKGAGAAVAAVSMAVKSNSESPVKWIEDGASTGGKFAGKGAAYVLGTGLGLAFDAARLPSIVVKAVLKGSFAVVGGTIGFFAASVRAIFNK